MTDPADPADPASADRQAVLEAAQLEALSRLWPGWRIWLDSGGWHARRRDDGFVQNYQPDAPAFYVRGRTAAALAARLLRQEAADPGAAGRDQDEPA